MTSNPVGAVVVPPFTAQQKRVASAAGALAKKVYEAPAPKTNTEARVQALQDELEAMELIPDGARMPADHSRQIAIMEELGTLGQTCEEQGVAWYKPEELSVVTVTVLGIEILPNDLDGHEGATQRVYRVRKGGEEILIGETWGLRGLARYSVGTRVSIRSLGKCRIEGTAKTVHRFALAPTPGPRDVLPILTDCRGPV